jgi:TonB family protein
MRITLRVILLIVLATSPLEINLAQDVELTSSLISRQQKQKSSDEDKVYSSKEVSEKAVIKSRPEVQLNPYAIQDCPKQGSAVVKMVLHKSGKVKDVKLVRPMSCGFDKLAAEAARKIKFIPARKDGAPVSQYFMVEYAYESN